MGLEGSTASYKFRIFILDAALERFFWSLKHEWTNHRTYNNLKGVRRSVFLYIESFYNPVRLHQTLGYLSPDQYEAEHTSAQAV